MNARPQILVELGAELERAARRTLSAPPPRRRLRRVSPALAVALAVLLVLAAVAAATVLLIAEGSPLPAPHAADLSPWENPVPGSVRLAGLDAPDPSGGPVWDIRLSRSRTGETCTAVGQLFDGRFGVVGLDHVFRALPVGGVDACGVPGIAGPVLAGARVFAGRAAGEARTVVNGVAGAGARSVTAYGPDGARRLRLGPQGSFITVYRGYLEEARPRIVVVDAHGRSRTIAFASSAAFEAADPDGGAPWRIGGGAAIGTPGAHPDENCAQASQEAGRTNPGGPIDTALSPEICGRLASQPLFVSIRRFDPGDGQGGGTPWGENPARTLVYGAAAPRVRSLTLLGAGAARQLPIDAHGGVFLAVLDGHVDPRSLTLVASLRDGRTVRYTHSSTLFDATTGKRLGEAPVEPYRALAHTGRPFPALEDPIPATVAQTQRAADPAGAAAWVLRSWQGNVDPRASFGGRAHPTRFYCWQAGVIEAGRLVEPVPGATPVPLSVSGAPAVGGGESECRGLGAPSAESLTPQVQTYADDASAYAPRPARTVVTGVVLPPATDPVLLGAGAPRALSTDANHAYLLVLPGSYWEAALRVRARLPGGRAVSSPVPSNAPILRPQVRAPDPDGSAPWGFTQTALCPTAWSISEIGRVVDDRITAIQQRTGQLAPGPLQSSTGSPCASRNARLQRRETQGPMSFQVLHSEPQGSGPLTQAEIDRRTLPGDTVVAGSAAADVASITLTTPADVRTVQPVGPSRVFLVVYDGLFYRGAFTATARLSDGRTVTERIPGASENFGEEQRRQPPSLAAQLRSDRITLTGMRAQVARVERATPGRRAQLLDGVPLSMLLQGLRQIRSSVATLTARIAYERAHPGVLPPE
ncbi:MAG: hypothetical protein ACLPUT_03435 [Solirubrobacteraceae bacterium]